MCYIKEQCIVNMRKVRKMCNSDNRFSCKISLSLFLFLFNLAKFAYRRMCSVDAYLHENIHILIKEDLLSQLQPLVKILSNHHCNVTVVNLFSSIKRHVILINHAAFIFCKGHAAVKV